MARYCSSCGAQVIEGGAFCPKCGQATVLQRNSEAAAPPAAAAAPSQVRPVATAMAIPENVAGVLAYLFVPAIVFLFVEPYSKSRFIRFHSFQGIALVVIALVLQGILLSSIIGVILLVPLNIFWLMLVVICMIKAYQLQVFRLPLIGEFAEKQADK